MPPHRAHNEGDTSRLKSRLDRYMHERGLRQTDQRRAVVDIFLASDSHLSIEDLLERSRLKNPQIGYATVYRTLKLLQECGLANERQFGDGVSRYEIAWENEHHDHLICMNCKKIVEFEDDRIEDLQERVAKAHNFDLVRHKHELYGFCSECQNKQ